MVCFFLKLWLEITLYVYSLEFKVSIVHSIIDTKKITCILFDHYFLLNAFIHPWSLISLFGMNLKQHFINVWLKTCWCIPWFEKRKAQFTNSIAFLMALLFDFWNFKQDTDTNVDVKLWCWTYKMWFDGGS